MKSQKTSRTSSRVTGHGPMILGQILQEATARISGEHFNRPRGDWFSAELRKECKSGNVHKHRPYGIHLPALEIGNSWSLWGLSFLKKTCVGWHTLPNTSRCLTRPLKSYLLKRKPVFRLSIFRGYVKLPGLTPQTETINPPKNRWCPFQDGTTLRLKKKTDGASASAKKKPSHFPWVILVG